LISHSESILFLASTNLPWTLDPALLRRFQQILNIDLPDVDQRIAILQKNLLPFGGNQKKPDFNYQDLASKTEGFSGSDLDRACGLAIQKLFRRRVKMKEEKNGAKIKKELSRNVFAEDLEECVEKIRPLNEAWKRKYEKWKCGNDSNLFKN
jgi:SpoVK/Ycf46/Vps4 family AAA+-type ATPase